MTDTCRPKLRSYDLNLKLCEAPPEGWRRVLKAASGLLVRPDDRNRVVAYVRGVGGRGDEWAGSVQLHAIEIDGKLLPGDIISAELSPFVADEIEVLTVTLAVGQFRTESIRRQTVTTDDSHRIVAIHHGWRALVVRGWRWGRSTAGERFPILAP